MQLTNDYDMEAVTRLFFPRLEYNPLGQCTNKSESELRRFNKVSSSFALYPALYEVTLPFSKLIVSICLP